MSRPDPIFFRVVSSTEWNSAIMTEEAYQEVRASMGPAEKLSHTAGWISVGAAEIMGVSRVLDSRPEFSDILIWLSWDRQSGRYTIPRQTSPVPGRARRAA